MSSETELARTLANLPEVELVILFGSRARGTAGRSSDWDLAVKPSPETPETRRPPKPKSASATGALHFDADKPLPTKLVRKLLDARIAETMPNKTSTKKKTFNAPKTSGPTVEVRTPNVPGYTTKVDKAKYEAMKKVLLKVMPKKAPGITQAEMFSAIKAAAPKATFPGTTYMWWGKCVQLDLEARGFLERDGGKPLRWHRQNSAGKISAIASTLRVT